MKRLFTVIVVMMTVVLMACGNKVDSSSKVTKEEPPIDFGSIKFYGIGLTEGYLGLDFSEKNNVSNIKNEMDNIRKLKSSDGLEKFFKTHITIGDSTMSFDIQELNGTGDINVRISKNGGQSNDYKIPRDNPLVNGLKTSFEGALKEHNLSVEKIEKAYKDGFVLK